MGHFKPSASPVMAAPNVIPMADIVLVLLIIFMVVTPMLTSIQASRPREGGQSNQYA